MNLLVVGAGAVGGTVAARLVSAGIDLAVFDTSVEHVDRIRSDGFRLGGLESDAYVKLDVSTQPPTEIAGLVLLAVRSASTEAALAAIEGAVGPRTDVVSMQNGLNEDRIAAVIGRERTIGCSVGFGATWIAPGHVELDSIGDLVIGRLDGTADDRLTSAAGVLSHAFPTRVTDNVLGALWAKMLVNSMTVMGALGGMLVGDLLSTSERRGAVAGVVAEGARVARAEGVELLPIFGAVEASLVDDPSWPDVLQKVLTRFGERYSAIRSVTWRDFELGRATEIHAVTGEIVRRGETLGVPTPLNAKVYAMLREIEEGKRRPDAGNLEALA